MSSRYSSDDYSDTEIRYAHRRAPSPRRPAVSYVDAPRNRARPQSWVDDPRFLNPNTESDRLVVTTRRSHSRSRSQDRRPRSPGVPPAIEPPRAVSPQPPVIITNNIHHHSDPDSDSGSDAYSYSRSRTSRHRHKASSSRHRRSSSTNAFLTVGSSSRGMPYTSPRTSAQLQCHRHMHLHSRVLL